MNAKTAPLLTGIFMIVSGVFIAIFSYQPSPTIKYVVAVSSFLGGALTLLATMKGRGAMISVTYSWLVGLGGIGYGLAVAFFTRNLNDFLEITGFSLLVLGLMEVTFTYQILNLKRKPVASIALYKIFTGLAMGIGAMWILIASTLNENVSLLFAGIVLSLAGLSFILVSNHIVGKDVAVSDTGL
ncbi:hypothetical protein FEM33_09890 [Dyadobacter flavalbus]|uniref:DUF308 domain-containing protein n=1 Tax=Dyadobacter flavalbus TaxID=2579942 RepID=A0A5M8QUC0_9BACT|nr:hypothetical protein [Dyadobacter flavalbus]KAA6439875.1 hypothetical protein FEM33_09890 [Dyadobacter flavalbus]